MSSFGCDMKVCGTCDRWSGPRDPGRIIPSAFVWVEASTDKGMCFGGGFANMKMAAMASCSKHEKWNVLK